MTRVVQLADDAYALLARQKKPGESFSDVVRRTFPGRQLGELASLVGKAKLAEAQRRWDLADAIEQEDAARRLQDFNQRAKRNA